MPNQAELDSLGFTAADYADDTAAVVWPENWPVWLLWGEMRGQWRVGINGAYAIDYTPLFARMDRLALRAEDWEEMFADFRVIEAVALGEMNKAQR
jgi:hypothetical protein